MHRVLRVSDIVAMAALIVVAGFVSALLADIAPAQSSSASAVQAKRLNALFERLKSAKDEYEAGKIENEISELWSKSGRPEIDELFGQASLLIVDLKLPLALQALDDIVQRAPDWAEGWNTRATVHHLLGAFDRALADSERALTLEPRHFYALRTMGTCLEHKGHYRDALAAYRMALVLHPFLSDQLDVIPELEKKIGKPQ